MRTILTVLALLTLASSLCANERVEIMFGRDGNQPESAGTSVPLPIDPWQAPKSVDCRRADGDIIVHLSTCTLVFSGSTASIRDAKVLGTQMVGSLQPNLVMVSSDGTEYSQDLSKNGKLDAFDDGDNINVFGTFTLTAKSSKTSLVPQVWYKIDRETGYTQVRYTLCGNVAKTDPPIEITKLYVDTIVGNVSYNKVDHFWQGCGVTRNNEGLWDPWTNFKADMSQDRVVVSDKIVNMMMVNNARMGFATEPISFEGLSTEEGLDGYLAYLTKNGEHLFRYTFINHKSAPYKLTQPFDIEFAMCYLPTREYRKPKLHFFTGAAVGLSEAARVGIDMAETWGYMGYPYGSEEENSKKTAYNKIAHSYDIKHTHFCANWYGLSGLTPRYPEPAAESCKTDQIHSFGRPYTWDANNPDHPVMCLNSEGWFENYYMNAIHNVLDFDGDGLRVDCGTPFMCNNTLHGCSTKYSTECLGYYNFGKQVSRFFRTLEKQNNRPYILAHATNIQPSVNAYLDLALSGEGSAGFPSESDRDAVFTAFMFGRPFAKLVGGNSPASLDKSKIFEMMIARCGALTYWFTFTAPETANWMKYFNPLRVFNVNNCELHHPFHYDYSEYTRQLSDKVFPIVYSRKNEALVVVCNESEAGGKGDLHLNSKALGLTGRLMVFEPFTGGYTLTSAENGAIALPIQYPKPWDVDYYMVRNIPKIPEIVWYDALVYHLSQSWSRDTLAVKTRNIPEETYSFAYLHTAGMGRPSSVKGAELLSYNPTDGMVKVRIAHDKSGVNEFSIRFDKNKSQTKPENIDVEALYKKVSTIADMVANLNYYAKDKNALQGYINSIRNNADSIPAEGRREILTRLADIERFVYACEEVKSYGKLAQDMVDQLKSMNQVEQQWTILAPFRNDPKSDYGYDSNILPADFDFSANYAGVSGQETKQIRGKNVIGYYLDFNYLGERPGVNAVGGNAQSMTAFAASKVVSDKDRTARLKLSGIGRVKVWLNGALLDIKGADSIQQCGAGGTKPEPFKATCSLHLVNGENILIYKVESGPENWEVFTSVFDVDGNDLGTTIKFLPILDSAPVGYGHTLFLNAKEALEGS